MNHSLMSVTAAALLGLSATAQAAEPLKIGISAEPYPPFTYTSSDGEWTGFEVELGMAFCEAMERPCEITPTGWSGIIPSLKAGRIDMIMNSMSITEARQRVIDFSDPYYFSGSAYVAAKDLTLEIPEGLSDYVLGVQAATTQATYARRALRDSVGDTRLYDQAEQVNRDLLAGRLDVILADKIAMIEFLQRDAAAGYEVKATAPRHEAFGEGIGLGLRQGDDALEADLNAAITEVREDGTCAALSEKYFATDICT
ncbi:transporter substrate-binding domain-containing protein [Halomonas borealis]|uniref:transporter substrate-binding domain-containing protein n=1 Tax=Halomonas borealis TaxID=2508710 RepID=UPI00109FE299|nr:transporter substrate-binding domain-containing protein [Halomonas borealis]